MVQHKNDKKEIVAPHLPKEVRQKGKGDYTQTRWFMSVVVWGALFGFFSGVVGGIAINSRYIDDWLWGGGTLGTQFLNQARRPDNKNLSQDDLTNKILASTVDFYPAEARPASDRLVDPGQKIASGFFLTADGWLAGSKNSLARFGKNDLVAVSNDKKILTVEKIIGDPVSDLVLVKVKTEGGAAALPFSSADELAAGSEVWLSWPGIGLQPVHLVASNVFAPRNKADYYFSSESLYRRGLISMGFAKELAGAPVVNSRGEIVGMMSGSLNERGLLSSFLRTSVMKTAFRSAIDQGAIHRAWLGLRFTEQSQLVKSAAVETKWGVVLLNDPVRRLPAVDKKSPLAAVGLKAGDLVVSIDGEPLTPLRTLPEILADYSPGDKMEVVYRRGNEDKKVSVVLGEIK